MRHPLHAICPYFAMFPEDFVRMQLLAYTKLGDLVFDPFSGRGTTVFESLLNGRRAAGVDINPVAACVAGAKADPPRLSSVLKSLDVLESIYHDSDKIVEPEGEFFESCFHRRTLQEILFLQRALDWRSSRIDRFIAAVTLGVLHGESHKSQNCLSNRMPRTISTKPDYSVRWWAERGLTAPERATFEILRRGAVYRLSVANPTLRGKVRLRDARSAARGFPKLKQQVKLIVTSPPYLDTTDYSEDQWLRLWFLGGPARPRLNANRDDRHTSIEKYWKFLSEAWAGCRQLAQVGTYVVIRIGGTRLEKTELLEGLSSTLAVGFDDLRPVPLHAGVSTMIKKRQTNAFRPGTSAKRYEHDFAFELR